MNGRGLWILFNVNKDVKNTSMKENIYINNTLKETRLTFH